MSVAMVSSQTNVASGEIGAVDRAIIDVSARLPVLFFYASAMGWLLVAMLLGFVASVKLHSPEFLGGYAWLTYGRVWPAYLDCFVYGWAIPAGIGTSLWIMARICRVELGRPVMLFIAGLFWNIGVAAGILEILAGNSLGFELLEFPRYVAGILFVSYSLIVVWALVMLKLRASDEDSVPAWYLTGAFFWFPWLLGATYITLTVARVQGVMQSVISGWYAQGLLGFWFVSVGLGVAYYLIPKASGRPIYSRSLALLGFWSFAIFWGWTGATRYTGGPVPVWLATSGIVAGILMLIPVAATAVNLAMTLKGNFQMLQKSPTIRFVGYGTAAWVAASLIWILTSLRSVDRITHFTQVGVGETHLIIYAFYTMVIMGSMYYIIPRLVGGEWISPNFIVIHFFGAAYGIGLLAFLLIVGGISQGLAWSDPATPTVQVVDIMSPYFRGRSIAWLLLIGGNTIFGFHFLMMLLDMGKRNVLPALLGSNKGGAK